MSESVDLLVEAAAKAIENTVRAACPPNIVPVMPPGAGPEQMARPAIAAALRLLAVEAMDDMRTAQEAARSARSARHKHNFLGRRAAYLRMHERLVQIAEIVERGEQG